MQLILIPIILLFPILAYSQDAPTVVAVKGEWQVQWYQDRESKDEAKQRAEEQAKINALENAFGTAVIQGNSTYIENVNTGEKVETKSVFKSIGNTLVGGEIIEVTDIDFKESTDSYRKDGKKVTDVYIRCKIKALAKELTETSVNFEAYTLSGQMKNNKATTFYDGDDIYFYFKSPVSGYLSLYVDITGSGITQRILPYQDVPKEFENGMPVEADKAYFFFSNEKNDDKYMDKGILPDEIYASVDEKIEHWRFFVIFSKNPLNKPSLESGMTENELTDYEKKIKVTVPKALDSEDFQRWIINNYQMRNDFQRSVIDVNVMK